MILARHWSIETAHAHETKDHRHTASGLTIGGHRDRRDSHSDTTRRRRGGAHRRPTSAGPGGRVMVLSVASGALIAAGSSTGHASPADAAPQTGVVQNPSEGFATPLLSASPQILQIPKIPDASEFAEQLGKARQRAEEAARQLSEQAARESAVRAQDAELTSPPRSFGGTMAPVSGTLTSSYGARWGTTHYGLDIANDIGTPIVSVTDGTVLEAGPASGFGLWVRILQDDGTIGVFGHINEALVTAGQKIRAGEQIATVGNRGQSTGPHLHYEVWQSDGTKIDPTAWLRARGVNVTSSD
ncbi:M23 family peptidase [Rhodococcus sp. ABRD24]|nr:M23 family peptidase [Rhodococcus sp. ABRD24]